MELNDNRYYTDWNQPNGANRDVKFPTHVSRGFRISYGRRGPRPLVLNNNAPLVQDWYNAYLEVEDVRQGEEQGHADLWGIPEALTQYIFQFLTKKNLCSFGGFPEAQKAPSRIPGDCFSTPIRSGWGRYAMKSPEGLDGVGIEEARQEICTDTSVRTG